MKFYHKSAYGITDKLCDYYWWIAGALTVAVYALIVLYHPAKWYMALILVPFIVWMGPMALLLPVYLIEMLLHSILNIPKGYKNVLAVLAFFLWLGLSAFISSQLVRACAVTFATPNSHYWEIAYASESPNAKCYHKDEDCKYLKNTRYDIDILSVEEAEEFALIPCKHCLKNSVRYQYDEIGALLIAPIAGFLLWIIHKLEIFSHSLKRLYSSDASG